MFKIGHKEKKSGKVEVEMIGCSEWFTSAASDEFKQNASNREDPHL